MLEENVFADLYNDILGSIYWKDLEGFYLGCNDHAAVLAGFSSPSQIIGKTDYDLFSKEIADNFRKNDLCVIKNNENIMVEEESFDPKGLKIIQLSSKKPILNKNGVVTGLIGNTVNITNIKRVELELKAALVKSQIAEKTKDAILANFRHDWVTPVSGLSLLKDLVETAEDPDRKESLQMIYDSNCGLFSHLNGTKELVNSIEGRLPIICKIINCYEILQDLYKMYRPAVTQKEIALEIEVNRCDWEQELKGDQERIIRILMTFLSNAVKFTNKEGCITLSLSKKILDDGKIQVNYFVKDTGIGISDDNIKNVYESFYKVRESYNTSDLTNSGAGVGLAIAKRYADDIDAQLNCESDLGKGSIFSLSLILDCALVSSDELKTRLKK